jgi:hypothetical protein
MKRIDKSVASQIEAAQRAGTAQFEDAQAENMQAAWTEAWGQQINRSGEIYGRLFAGVHDEFAAFLQKRLDANMETARAWSACRSVNEALDLQQSWLRSAIEHYSDQGTRVSELCRSAVFHAGPETAQQTAEEPKAAPERKPAHETHTPHIRRAAE